MTGDGKHAAQSPDSENPVPENPVEQSEGDEETSEHKRTFSQRIPRKLFGGRVRTTTVALVVLFIGALLLYGQRADYYSNIDEQDRQNQISQVQQPRSTTPEPTVEETPESTPSTTTTPTTTVPRTGAEESSSSNSEAPTPTATEPGGGGFRVPELPTISIAP